MNVTELPVTFDCQGVTLIGVIHIPEKPRATGILPVAAGGIQYRAGCGRQLITLARQLSAKGIPVMRFDHRGHGDSVGKLLGFEHMEEDLARALETFQHHVPELQHVVLYGGCEAASAIMISGHNYPLAKSAIVANPWVDSEKLRALASRNHYLRRLREPGFWKKVFTLQYNPMEYVGGAWSRIRKKLAGGPSPAAPAAGDSAGPAEVHFQDRMLSGFQKFDGPVMFLKSGMSIIADEFDLLVGSSREWEKACNRDTISRIEIPGADQAFSTAAARVDLFRVAEDWIEQMNAKESASRGH